MSNFKMTPKTLKGRNRIREAGTNVVEVFKSMDNPAFAPGTGTWLLVRFKGKPSKLNRWIHPTNDPEFEVEGFDFDTNS